MRMRGAFLIHIQQLQDLVANDNRDGDFACVARNMITTELTRTLAKFTRDEGVS
jgi:hypothetical protein